MPIYRVEGPDGQIYRVEAPEGATEQQIFSFLQSQLAQQTATAEQQPESGVIAQLKRGAEETVSGLRTGLSGLLDPEAAAQEGLRRQEEIGQKYADEVSLEKLKQAYAERGLLGAAGEVGTQAPKAIAAQLPNLAGIFGASRAGALAGGKAFGARGAIVGGISGALGYGFTQAYGSNIERQAAEDVEAGRPVDIEAGTAAAVAVPQAALEAAGPAIAFGGRLVSKLTGIPAGALFGERSAAAARKLADERLLSLVTKGTVRGVAAEVPTELGQQVLERYQAGLPLTDDEALKEYGETAYQTALLGPLGIAGRVSDRAGAREQVREEEQAVAAETAQEETVSKDTPEYADQVSQEYESLMARREELMAQRDAIPKVAKDADPATKLAAKQEREPIFKELQDVTGQLKGLAPEYLRVQKMRTTPPTAAVPEAEAVAEPTVKGKAAKAKKTTGVIERPFTAAMEEPEPETYKIYRQAAAAMGEPQVAPSRPVATIEQDLENNQEAISKANETGDVTSLGTLLEERDRLDAELETARQQPKEVVTKTPEQNIFDLNEQIENKKAELRKNIGPGVDPEKARKSFKEIAELMRQLRAIDPGNVRYRQHLDNIQEMEDRFADIPSSILKAEDTQQTLQAREKRVQLEGQLADKERELDAFNRAYSVETQKDEFGNKVIPNLTRADRRLSPQNLTPEQQTRLKNIYAELDVIGGELTMSPTPERREELSKREAELTKQFTALADERRATLSNEISELKKEIEKAGRKEPAQALLDYYDDIQTEKIPVSVEELIEKATANAEDNPQAFTRIPNFRKRRAYLNSLIDQRIKLRDDAFDAAHSNQPERLNRLLAEFGRIDATIQSLIDGAPAGVLTNQKVLLTEIMAPEGGIPTKGYMQTLAAFKEKQEEALQNILANAELMRLTKSRKELRNIRDDLKAKVAQLKTKLEEAVRSKTPAAGLVQELRQKEDRLARLDRILDKTILAPAQAYEKKIDQARLDFIEASIGEANTNRYAEGLGPVTQAQAIQFVEAANRASLELVTRLDAGSFEQFVERVIAPKPVLKASTTVKKVDNTTQKEIEAVYNSVKDSSDFIGGTLQKYLEGRPVTEYSVVYEDVETSKDIRPLQERPFGKPAAATAAIIEQLRGLTNQLIAPPTGVRQTTPLQMQFAGLEAERVAEAKGETAATVGGQARRQREYIEGLLDKLGDIPRSQWFVKPYRDAFNEVRDVLDAGADTKALRDAVQQVLEDIVNRRIKPQLPSIDLDNINQELKFIRRFRQEGEVTTKIEGQKDLFSISDKKALGAPDDQRSLDELGAAIGYIRKNFDNFENSPAVREGRRVALIEQRRTAATRRVEQLLDDAVAELENTLANKQQLRAFFNVAYPQITQSTLSPDRTKLLLNLPGGPEILETLKRSEAEIKKINAGVKKARALAEDYNEQKADQLTEVEKTLKRDIKSFNLLLYGISEAPLSELSQLSRDQMALEQELETQITQKRKEIIDSIEDGHRLIRQYEAKQRAKNGLAIWRYGKSIERIQKDFDALAEKYPAAAQSLIDSPTNEIFDAKVAQLNKQLDEYKKKYPKPKATAKAKIEQAERFLKSMAALRIRRMQLLKVKQQIGEQQTLLQQHVADSNATISIFDAMTELGLNKAKDTENNLVKQLKDLQTQLERVKASPLRVQRIVNMRLAANARAARLQKMQQEFSAQRDAEQQKMINMLYSNYTGPVRQIVLSDKGIKSTEKLTKEKFGKEFGGGRKNAWKTQYETALTTPPPVFKTLEERKQWEEKNKAEIAKKRKEAQELAVIVDNRLELIERTNDKQDAELGRIISTQTERVAGPTQYIQSAAPSKLRTGVAETAEERRVRPAAGIVKEPKAMGRASTRKFRKVTAEEYKALADAARKVEEDYRKRKITAAQRTARMERINARFLGESPLSHMGMVSLDRLGEPDQRDIDALDDEAYIKIAANTFGGQLSVDALESIRAGNLVGAINSIEQTSINFVNKAVAAKLKMLLQGVKIEIVAPNSIVDKDGAIGSGVTLRGGRVILLDAQSGLNEHVILHEAVHAATLKTLRAPIESLTADQRKARQELEALFNSIKEDPEFADQYGKYNIEEFVSEALSNERFQGLLRNRPWTMGTAWESFKRLILRFLGIDSPKNMLEATLLAAENIMTRVPRPSSVDAVLAEPAFFFDAKPAPDSLKNAVALTDELIAKQKPITQRIRSANAGLEFVTNYVDNFAPLEKATKLMDELKGTQVMYFARMFNQRMNFVAQSLSRGVVQLTPMKRKDGQIEYVYESKPGANIKDIAEIIGSVGKKVGGADRASSLFTLYLADRRAQRVGYEKLNFGDGMTQQKMKVAMKEIEAAGIKDTFERARALYNQYNRDLIKLSKDSGVLSAEQAAELTKADDYIPFYREVGGDLVIDIGLERPFRIGNLRDMPHLKELIGGDQRILDFTTSVIQNTNMLVDMSLNNLASKSAVFELAGIGLAEIKSGTVSGPDVVRFKDNGQDKYAVITTDVKGIPGTLLVQGMAGIPAQLTGFMRYMSLPSRLLRKAVTVNPMYAFRQLVRDSVAAPIVSGANFTPLLGALREIGSAAGKTTLEARGVIGGQQFTGTQEDMGLILRQIAGGDQNWLRKGIMMPLAKLESLAMNADGLSRRAQYNSYIRQGMSEMEATLMSLESMNFTKRGMSPSVHILNSLIPFFNAQIQGMNVLFRAMSGNMPLNQKLDIKRKFWAKGAMLMATAIAYTALMEDDEAYKNATADEKYNNFFIRIPGFDEPVRMPVPFEVGYMFKSVPEALYHLLSSGDDEQKIALEGLNRIAINMIPGGSSMPTVDFKGAEIPVPVPIPQGIKPVMEMWANKSFFTREPLMSLREMSKLPEKQYRDSTTEIVKMFGDTTGISPIQTENMIRGYFGALPMYILAAASSAIPGDPGDPTPADKPLSRWPLFSQLFQSNEASAIISNTYDRVQEIQKVKTTYNQLIKEGRVNEAVALLEQRSADYAKVGIANSFEAAMNKLTQAKRAIVASQLPPEEKKERLKEIQRIKIEVSKQYSPALSRE
jgi:hypothetical protein